MRSLNFNDLNLNKYAFIYLTMWQWCAVILTATVLMGDRHTHKMQPPTVSYEDVTSGPFSDNGRLWPQDGSRVKDGCNRQGALLQH